MPETTCTLCGRPYWSGPSHWCGNCLSSPPPYQSARAAVVYGGEAAHSILKLKYHGGLNQAAALAALFCERDVIKTETLADIVIPMPLTAERLARRGFNQAAELAAEVFGEKSVPVSERILERTHDGHRRLAALSAKERRQAVKGCFRVAAPQEVRGAAIMLFDDILTTGSTAGEAARTLMEGGATRVDIRTIARTVPAQWR
ncbi:amidophosphoribosyltransferase [Deltaproteobacteria bacterium Smac51]|nr:amidophosphoribosyltransferase [Deltaproteobacteria bacterium Smac51]